MYSWVAPKMYYWASPCYNSVTKIWIQYNKLCSHYQNFWNRALLLGDIKNVIFLVRMFEEKNQDHRSLFINLTCCWILGNQKPNLGQPDNQEQSWKPLKFCLRCSLGVPPTVTVSAWKVIELAGDSHLISNSHSFVWNVSYAAESIQLFKGGDCGETRASSLLRVSEARPFLSL